MDEIKYIGITCRTTDEIKCIGIACRTADEIKETKTNNKVIGQ